jgi:predicted GIY-YIG superfamily endonuclease
MKIIGLDLSTKKYCVYLFTFPNNKHYCGYSSNIRNRWSNNGKNYEKCPLVYKAIQKYGWSNIKKEILYSFNNKEEALKKEKETIEKMDLLNPAK